MGKLIAGIVNLLPNILRKVIPEGYMTKIGGAGMILAGVGGLAMSVAGIADTMSDEAAVALILSGLSILGLYSKVERDTE